MGTKRANTPRRWRSKPLGYRSLGVSFHSTHPFGWTLILSLWRWERMWHHRNDAEIRALGESVARQIREGKLEVLDQ